MFVNDMSQNLLGAVNFESIIINADGTRENSNLVIVKEHFLDLIVNEQLVAKLVCTPSNLVELAIGRLITEGIISGENEVESIFVCTEGNTIKVFLKEGIKLELENIIQKEPTCCTSNKVLLTTKKEEKLKELDKALWKWEFIFELANEFASGSKIHKQTKGTHSCILGYDGEIKFVSEDIGRHNALDKAIGYGAVNNLQPEKCVLFTTGRVPTDMVEKVIIAKMPVLVSKAVPTDAAVAMAKEYNLTLICKAWPDKCEIFNEAR